MPICDLTELEFELTEFEKSLHRKLGVPEPRVLPAKRLQHRLTFRNERVLYKRTSGLSGKSMISIYAPDSPYVVYATEEWWSDQWDGADYGRDFDFNRPFFEQFHELQLKVPRIALFNVNPHNSDYCQQAYNNKNCYLCTVLKDCEDSMYLSHSNKVRDSYDCDYVQDSELCYDCLDSHKLYGCVGCDNCQNSHELFFCNDCIGCSNCIASWGLRNQSYCVINEQYSKEDYAAHLAGLTLSKASSFVTWSKKLREAVAVGSRRVEYNINVVDCLGNHLINAKNCYHCYDAFQIEECAHSTWIFESHHCADVYGMGTSEWVYESLGVEKLNFAAFSTFVSDSAESFYSDLCFYCQNIFGCVGLRRKRNSILNKEYPPEEYKALRERIVAHMMRTGEWGRFFPAKLSVFAYNESVANERFPLDQLRAEAAGYRWRPSDTKAFQQQTYQIADDSQAVCEDCTKAILSCEATKTNYRITPQELNFYRKLNLPIPRLSPDARYRSRMERRNA